jgi:hypothetical protein
LGSSTTWKAEFGEDAAHQFVGAVAAREGDEFAVEVDVGRAQRFPVTLTHRPLPLHDRLGERVQGVRRFAQPPDDGALHERAGAVDVLHVLDRQNPDEHPAVQLVDEQPLMGEQPERLAQGVAGDPQRSSDAVLRQPCPRREVALGDAAPEDVRDPLGRAGTTQEGPVVGQSAQLLCHARNSTADTRTKQQRY